MIALPVPASVASARATRMECHLDDDRVTEASGLVVLDDGRRIVHNDSGDRARYFVLDGCAVVAEVRLAGIDARDFEDVALGPAPGGGPPSLWFADTGNNDADDLVPALVVTAVPATGTSGTVTAEATSYPVAPPSPVDVEALVVDPAGGGPALITKSPFGTAQILVPTAELSPGVATPLRRVGGFTLTATGTPGGPISGVRALAAQVAVTGADLSRDGGLLVVRTYTDLAVWRVRPGDRATFGERLDEAVLGPPVGAPLEPRRQGEGAGLLPDGSTVLLISEGSPAVIDALTVPRPAPLVAADATDDRETSQGDGAPAGADAAPAGGPSTGRGVLGSAEGLALVVGGGALAVLGGALLALARRRRGPGLARRGR